MKVIFLLKNNIEVYWEIMDPKAFTPQHFYAMIKAIRADGHFITEGCYIAQSEIIAIHVEGMSELVDVVDNRRGVQRVAH